MGSRISQGRHKSGDKQVSPNFGYLGYKALSSQACVHKLCASTAQTLLPSKETNIGPFGFPLLLFPWCKAHYPASRTRSFLQLPGHMDLFSIPAEPISQELISVKNG